MYEGFAEVYDTLMADVQYADWASFYAKLMAACGIRSGMVCECACGTGSLTIPLMQLGYRMTGVDMSQDMLWIASQKARAAGLAIPFVRQDMRKLHLHRPMDAVLATNDGVNYLLEEEDLLSFFRAAYETIRPGGGLFFDVSTPRKLKESLGNRIICDDTDTITYIWQNSYHEKTKRVDMHLCIFVKQSDGSYRRMDEEQTQAAHDWPRLNELLHQAGFDHTMIYGNTLLEAPRESEQRWHIAAIRRKEIDE